MSLEVSKKKKIIACSIKYIIAPVFITYVETEANLL